MNVYQSILDSDDSVVENVRRECYTIEELSKVIKHYLDKYLCDDCDIEGYPESTTNNWFCSYKLAAFLGSSSFDHYYKYLTVKTDRCSVYNKLHLLFNELCCDSFLKSKDTCIKMKDPEEITYEFLDDPDVLMMIDIKNKYFHVIFYVIYEQNDKGDKRIRVELTDEI